jgi:hypothetical protein
MHTNRRAGADRLTLVYILALIALAVLYRAGLVHLFGHARDFPWNLAPVGALALFAGSRLRSAYAVLVPLVVMLASDLLLRYPLGMTAAFSWLGTPIIYGSFALYVLIGRLIHQGRLAPVMIGVAAVLAGTQFYLLTNFAVWLGGTLYSETPTGLLECYVVALPFYRNTLAGDLIFSALIFGLHAALVWGLGRVKERQPA